MRLIARVTLWTLASISALVFGLAALIFGPSFVQPLYLPKLIYDIPNGYRGWVRFEVSDPRCSHLPHQGRSLLFVVDPAGRGCTSDAAPAGWRSNKYYYVRPDGSNLNLPETGWGKGGLIWDPLYRISGTQKTYIFFVGTEQEFHAAEQGPIN
jgi:hypothetical protein